MHSSAIALIFALLGTTSTYAFDNAPGWRGHQAQETQAGAPARQKNAPAAIRYQVFP